jgi:hypothetical protein
MIHEHDLVVLPRGAPERGLLSGSSGAGKLRHKMSLLGLCGIVIVLLAVFVPWTSRARFLARFDDIRPGMTEPEVRRVMREYIEGTGWPQPDGAPGEFSIKSALVFRHDAKGWQSSDWGVVYLENGVVVRTEFLPD